MTLEELKKSNEQYTQGLDNLKNRQTIKLAGLEKQIHDLTISNRELKLDLKHQRVKFEGEKYDLNAKIEALEIEKSNLTSNQKPELNSKFQEKLKSDYELKFLEFRREIETEKEMSKKLQKNDENEMLDLKLAQTKEADNLRSQIKSLKFKNRSQNEKIEQLKKNDQTITLKQKIEDLTAQLESYKNTVETSTSLNTSNSHEESPRAKNAKIKEQTDNKPNVLKSQALTSRRDFFLCEKCESLKNQVIAKDDSIRNLINKIEHEKNQTERCRVELEKSVLETRTLRQNQQIADQKHSESEIALKNEIKFLIGKVLKAKSKLAVESELSDSFKREGILSTLRSRSVNKSRYNPRPPSPILRSISPLNLSVISRAESPFGVNEIDLSRYA